MTYDFRLHLMFFTNPMEKLTQPPGRPLLNQHVDSLGGLHTIPPYAQLMVYDNLKLDAKVRQIRSVLTNHSIPGLTCLRIPLYGCGDGKQMRKRAPSRKSPAKTYTCILPNNRF
jgi:hypothetical protein